MAKTIKYKTESSFTYYDMGKEPILDEDGNIVIDDDTNEPLYKDAIQEKTETFLSEISIECPTQESLDANLPMVQSEAYNGEYTIEGEFDPVDENPTTEEILDVLLGVN